jgi:hypothetical protein
LEFRLKVAPAALEALKVKGLERSVRRLMEAETHAYWNSPDLTLSTTSA